MLVSDDAPFCAQVTGVDCGCVERALTDRTQVGVFCVRRVTIDMVVGGVSTPKVGVFPALSECTELLCFVNESSGVYPNFLCEFFQSVCDDEVPRLDHFLWCHPWQSKPEGVAVAVSRFHDHPCRDGGSVLVVGVLCVPAVYVGRGFVHESSPGGVNDHGVGPGTFGDKE